MEAHLLQLPRKVGRKVVRLLRIEDKQRLFWSRYEPQNFGEWVGPYLYNKIAGHEPTFARPSNRSLSTVYTAAGSILRHAAENCIVWGSGIISRSDRFPRPHKVLAVRGPQTQRRMHELGYDCPTVFGDPAILLPLFYMPRSDTRHRVGVVPHFVDFERASALFGGTADVHMIDVTRPVEEVVDAIASCEFIVSSSLHGLIVAQAYGVPAAWVEFSDGLDGDGVKFADHYEAGGVPFAPRPHLVDGVRTRADLEVLVCDAPQPDLTSLKEPLLKACPFPRPR